MISPVVVEVNARKPFTHASPLLGNFDGAVVSGFFIAPTTAVLHTIASVQPDGVEEKGTRYATVDLMMVKPRTDEKPVEHVLLIHTTGHHKLEISTSHHHQVHGLGGSSRITRATGRIIRSRGVAYASMMILFIRGKVPFLSTLRCGVGGSLGKN